MKHVLLILLTTTNIAAMEEKKEQSSELKYPCPHAVITFDAKIKKHCRLLYPNDPGKERCISKFFEEFLANCKKEYKKDRSNPFRPK